MKRYRVSLGVELEYDDIYYKGSSIGATLKKFQVLDEYNNVIGTVVVETALNNNINLHPELTVTGKGYGQELYQLVSHIFNTRVVEWGPHPICKTEAAKNLWNSLQKKGLTEFIQWDGDICVRSIKV